MLKMTGYSKAERQSVINECSLMKAINSDHIVTFEEVFDYKGRVCVYLEMMDGGDLAHIIMSGRELYSE